MQLTNSLALKILTLTTITGVLAAPSLHDRTTPPASTQETSCSQNIGVQSCCSGAVTQASPSKPFYTSLLAQDPRLAGVLGFLEPLLEGLLGGVVGGVLGGIGGSGGKVGVAQQCTSTGYLSALSGINVVNCGSAKPKCCIAPDSKVNSPTTTINKGLIVTNVETGNLIFCPDIVVLGS